jgi:hypothetical protein
VITTILCLAVIGVSLLAWLVWWQQYQIALKKKLAAEQREYLVAALDILRVVKEYNTLAHTQHKDAQRMMNAVEQAAGSPPALIEAVKAVPDRTADKVVERIMSGDSAGDRGKFKIVPPARAEDANRGYG